MPDGPTVSNSSCLIALEAAGYLSILEPLYGTIDVPDAVAAECGSALPGWVQVHPVQSQTLVQSLKLDLGAGEALPADTLRRWLHESELEVLEETDALLWIIRHYRRKFEVFLAHGIGARRRETR